MTRYSLINKPFRLLLITISVVVIVEIISGIFHHAGYEGRQIVFYLRCLELIVFTGLWGFSSQKEWLKNITLSFVSLASILFLVDVIFFILIIIHTPNKIAKVSPPTATFIKPDKDLGYVPNADTTINAVLKFDTLTAYNAHYTFDKFSRRFNPFDTSKNKSRFAMLFGCSITFGEGLNDSETIPARFAQFSPDYHAYNFAYGGYGTQQMLANLQKPDIKNAISEKNGAAFYIFINPHINRAIGDMETYDAWGAYMPYYYEHEDTLIRKGNFKTGRWLISGIYTILGRSSFIKYFKINFPFQIKDRHYKLVTEMIKESYNQYVSKFGNNNFYVIIFPGEKLDIVPYLQKQGIKVLDYSKLFERWNLKYCYLPYDNHPRAIADKILAQKLSADIKKLLP